MQDKKTLSQQTFNKQAETYDQAIYGQHARSLYPFMLDKITHHYGQDILDVGCGTGELMKQILEEDPSRKLTGIDYSPNMIEQAKQKLGNLAAFQFADAQKLPFADNTFDMVTCCDSFHHYPAPDAVLQEMVRVLKPGGCLILGDCYQKGLSRFIMNLFMRYSREGDVKIYSRQEITAMVQEYFHAVKWVQVNSRSYILVGIK